MKEIPYHPYAVAVCGLYEGFERGEIVSTAAIDERPTNGLTRGMQAQSRDVGIVLVDIGVVTCRDDLIEPLAVPVEACRPLETRKKETLKHAFTPRSLVEAALRQPWRWRERTHRSRATGRQSTIGVDKGRLNTVQPPRWIRIEIP